MTTTPPKRKRGRPPLSEAEKEARRIAKEAEKQLEALKAEKEALELGEPLPATPARGRASSAVVAAKKRRFAVAFVECFGDFRAALKKSGLSSERAQAYIKQDPLWWDTIQQSLTEMYTMLMSEALDRAMDKKNDKGSKMLLEVLSAIDPQRWDSKVRAETAAGANPRTNTNLNITLTTADLHAAQLLDPAMQPLDITPYGEKATEQNSQGLLPAATEEREELRQDGSSGSSEGDPEG